MIRFAAHHIEGGQVAGIGLTKADFAKLMQGEIFVIDLGPMGIPAAELMVVGGENEQTITRDWQHKIGPHTKVGVNPTGFLEKIRKAVKG